MTFPLFNQEAYSQQLGTGPGGPKISQDGCAESDLAAICVWFGHPTDPATLNGALIGVNGYADNGNGQHDLLDWGAVTRIYPDITLSFNDAYPSSPADMRLIDGQLAKQLPVIVGVSFTHDPSATAPSHYPCLYRKNPDGTYQAMDPWGGKDIVFDGVYAVNGMSVAQCILQAVSYAGTVAQTTSAGTYYKGYDLSNQDSMKVAVDVLVRLQSGELVDASQLSSCQQTASEQQTKLSSLEDTVTNLNGITKSKDGQIAQLQGQVLSLETQLETAQQAIDSLKPIAAQVPALLAELTQAQHDRQQALDAQSTQNRALAQLKNSSYTTATLPTLINELLTRLANRLTGKRR